MAQQCPFCHKYFDGVVLHWRNSKCAEELKLKLFTTIPQNIFYAETGEDLYANTIDELDTLAINNECIITDMEFD